MRYTFAQFKAQYPDDDTCLDAVFQNRYGGLQCCPKCGVVNARFYRVKKRQSYACEWCGHQLYPLADTIFRKTTTPLWNWFYAIYLFSVSKNGVSAKELERMLGVTYKTAWRMAKQIRLLMEQDGEKLGGGGSVVEADETYVGSPYHGDPYKAYARKKPVMGLVERGGQARAVVTDWASATRAKAFVRGSLATGAELHTDESSIYRWAKGEYSHSTVNHTKKQYVAGSVTTNTIEGFWGNWKSAMMGTYRGVSPKYLQSYVNEFVFRYNYRTTAVCPVLLARAARRV
jgi:transposase